VAVHLTVKPARFEMSYKRINGLQAPLMIEWGIEQTLEAEVEQAVGRGYYVHGKGVEGDGSRALRNGVRRGHIDSVEGVIEFAVPQVRGLRPEGEQQCLH